MRVGTIASAERDLAHQHIVGGELAVGARDAEPGRGIALGVEIDDQRLLADRRQGRAQIDRGRGFADAALLIRHDEDAGATFLRARFGFLPTRCNSRISSMMPDGSERLECCSTSILQDLCASVNSDRYILSLVEEGPATRGPRISVHKRAARDSGAQARAVITSKGSGATSSIRSFRMSGLRPSSPATASRKSALLPVASIRRDLAARAAASARTRPGNPAPLPRSTSVFASAGTRSTIWAESQKCRRQSVGHGARRRRDCGARSSPRAASAYAFQPVQCFT